MVRDEGTRTGVPLDITRVVRKDWTLILCVKFRGGALRPFEGCALFASCSQRLTYRISCLYVPYGFSCDTNFENMLVSIVKNKIKTERRLLHALCLACFALPVDLLPGGSLGAWVHVHDINRKLMITGRSMACDDWIGNTHVMRENTYATCPILNETLTVPCFLGGR